MNPRILAAAFLDQPDWSYIHFIATDLGEKIEGHI